MNAITVILDNAGGVTVQTGDYAGYWQDVPEAAKTIVLLLDGEDTTLWDRDDEAATLAPTDETIRSGGYRVITLTERSDINRLDPDSGWFNESELAKRLIIAFNKKSTNNDPDNRLYAAGYVYTAGYHY